MAIGNGPIPVMLDLAVGALDLGGTEVATAIKGEQMMIPKKAKGLQRFAALDVAEEVGKTRSQGGRIYVVENIAHLGIGRDMLDAKDGFEVAVGVLASFVKGQQRRILQSEDGKPRHQRVC